MGRFPSKDQVQGGVWSGVNRSEQSLAGDASPPLDEFQDFLKVTTDKKGNLKKPPTEWLDMTRQQIMAKITEPWRRWVAAAQNGASELQKQEFNALMDAKAGNVADLGVTELASIPEWRLPPGVRGNESVRRRPVFSVVEEENPAPPPEFSCEGHSTYQSGKAKREWKHSKQVQSELQKSRDVLPEIPMGSILFCKTRAERGVEW